MIDLGVEELYKSLPPETQRITEVTSFPAFENLLTKHAEILPQELNYIEKIFAYTHALMTLAKSRRTGKGTSHEKEQNIKTAGAELIKFTLRQSISLNNPEEILGFLGRFSLCYASFSATYSVVEESHYPPNFIGCFAIRNFLERNPTPNELAPNIKKVKNNKIPQEIMNQYIFFNSDVEDKTKEVLRGIFGEILAYYYLQSAGLIPEIAGISQDVLQGADLFISAPDGKKMPVQVKGLIPGNPKNPQIFCYLQQRGPSQKEMRLEIEIPDFYNPSGLSSLEEILTALIAGEPNNHHLNLVKQQLLNTLSPSQKH